MALPIEERRRRQRVRMQERRAREDSLLDGEPLEPEAPLVPGTPLRIRCDRCWRLRDTTLGALGVCPGCGADGREPGLPVVLGLAL